MSEHERPLPSPLSYPDAVSRPAAPATRERAALTAQIVRSLMALTGCSRAEAAIAVRVLLRIIAEAQQGQEKETR